MPFSLKLCGTKALRSVHLGLKQGARAESQCCSLNAVAVAATAKGQVSLGFCWPLLLSVLAARLDAFRSGDRTSSSCRRTGPSAASLLGGGASQEWGVLSGVAPP